MTTSTIKIPPIGDMTAPLQRRICVAPMLDWAFNNFIAIKSTGYSGA
ncbi:MAG: hypothetical protein AB9Q19_01245 [Candidatus Reddybacter sp.]